MKKNSTTAPADFETLAEDAKALLVATGHLAEEKIIEARERLSAALERGKDTAMSGAKAADEAIREHPYPAVGIAFGVGALLGFLLARR